MGQEITHSQFSSEDFAEFRLRLEAETRLLGEWLGSGRFPRRDFKGGFELEAWLVDEAMRPAPANGLFLELLDSDLVVPELASFNIEFNSTPVVLHADAFYRASEELAATWRAAGRVAGRLDLRLAMIGILPTVEATDMCIDNMSFMERYRALNEQVLRLREGRPLEVDIRGSEHLHLLHDDVMLESATTSFQVHLKAPAEDAGRYFNASKILSAPLVAACANSPYLFGKQLWEESRIPLFEQAVCVGGSDETLRVTFGLRYVEASIFECFQANLHRYPVLLPMLLDEPPEQLAHLRLHNGTIWRWNRPLIGFDSDGAPHIRIEHRVIPAGPTRCDCIANAALYIGLCHALASDPLPPESLLPFRAARENFYRAARDGLRADIVWLDGKRVNVAELLREQLLPLAQDGLMKLGIDDPWRWLEPVAGRLDNGQNGAAWQRRWMAAHGRDNAAMTRAYLDNQETDLPVYRWKI
ncbi:MAG TPA: glutamate--cysteine ligase [Chromatiaceae bacterium]|nr:glutamate--cysteine ligase [Chromatiaceae bacterium]